MKPQPPPLTVGTPCPKQWAELTGDGTRRYCEQCQLHVHNLSAMTAEERGRFVEASGGQACIAYQLYPDGTMATPPRWPWLSRMVSPFKWAALTTLSAVMPFWFAGCTSRRNATPTMGVPLPPPPSASSPGTTHSGSDHASGNRAGHAEKVQTSREEKAQ